MTATVLQKRDRTFTVSILATVAQQFRSELRGEGIKADETPSVQEGKDFIAFSFPGRHSLGAGGGPLVAIEEIEILLETVGYGFTTNQIA
ncbi:MAG TPA: hypothetical protein VNL17_12905 [Verrucomicrobiae bacterium]|nr:hypothetical protein [Verrucomicrobiae bacterium]